MRTSVGLHHITAIAGDPQENLDFYAGVLGMRMVKKTINQDVPDTYHLYFADAEGNPGTDLTFFPWPSLPPRRDGSGHWGEISLIVSPASFHYWEDRLETAGAQVLPMQWRFDERVLPFRDPHGLRLSFVEAPTYNASRFAAWDGSPVPEAHQIRGFAGIRLLERDREATVRFLSDTLGFRRVEEDGALTRYVLADGAGGQRLDLEVDPRARRGHWGTGAVHHVAWRAADDEHQAALREQIVEAGGAPTGVIDRFWFRSVYVKEPGGALMEVATDGPGFAVDEEPARLGEQLVLPPWFEPQRQEIEATLPALTPPVPTQV